MNNPSADLRHQGLTDPVAASDLALRHATTEKVRLDFRYKFCRSVKWHVRPGHDLFVVSIGQRLQVVERLASSAQKRSGASTRKAGSRPRRSKIRSLQIGFDQIMATRAPVSSDEGLSSMPDRVTRVLTGRVPSEVRTMIVKRIPVIVTAHETGWALPVERLGNQAMNPVHLYCTLSLKHYNLIPARYCRSHNASLTAPGSTTTVNYAPSLGGDVTATGEFVQVFPVRGGQPQLVRTLAHVSHLVPLWLASPGRSQRAGAPLASAQSYKSARHIGGVR